MMFKVVSKIGDTYLIDNVTEIHYTRMKQSECKKEMNDVHKAISYWGEDSKGDQAVLRFYIQKGIQSEDNQVSEYHVLRPPAVLYLLNDKGDTIDKISV